MDRSRLTSYSQRTIRGRKRTVTIPGSFEDSGKWLRCWNCGFPVNVDRDLGGSTDQSGNYETEVYLDAVSPAGSGDSPIIGMDTLGMVGPIIENGADDEPITDYYTPRIPLVSHGCPLCGASVF